MDNLEIIKNIYSMSDLYDYIYKEEDDIAFYSSFVKDSKDAKILDLGCGTGRVSIPILKNYKNVSVSGVDISKDMLDLFKKKAGNEFEGRLFLFEDDIRSFDLKDEFFLIILSNNSFSHMTTEDDIERCLLNVRKHLRSDGLFLFSIFFPVLKALCKNKDNVYQVSVMEENGKSISVYESLEYNPFTQINNVTWYFCNEKEEKEVVKKTFQLRMFFHQEIKYILKYYGFKILNVYGDYDKSDIDSTSLNQIFVTKK